MKERWRVEVEYDTLPQRLLDDAIEAKAGKECTGSGFGGTRDIGFEFHKKAAALAAAKRIRTLRNKSNRLTARVEKAEDY